MHTGFWWRSLKERNQLGSIGIGGRVILKLTLKSVGRTCTVLIFSGKDKSVDFVNTVMNFYFP